MELNMDHTRWLSIWRKDAIYYFVNVIYRISPNKHAFSLFFSKYTFVTFTQKLIVLNCIHFLVNYICILCTDNNIPEIYCFMGSKKSESKKNTWSFTTEISRYTYVGGQSTVLQYWVVGAGFTKPLHRESTTVRLPAVSKHSKILVCVPEIKQIQQFLIND